MSRTVLIIVVLFTIIFASIILSLNKRSADMAEKISSNVYETNAENLGAYALTWAIKQVKDSTVTNDLTQNLANFNVLNGKIDSINYDFDWDSHPDTTLIIAYVKWIEGGESIYHQSSAVLKSSNNIPTNAIGTGGDLTIKGDSYKINGNTSSHVDINFEEIFGMTKEEMKVIADTVYTNPPNNVMPVENITWIVGDLKSSAEWWEGSGLLIVTGNCKITGGVFSGILYVMGEIEEDPLWVGPCDIYGAIICEGGTTVAGKTTITYDSDIVNDVYDDFLPPGSVDAEFKILAWYK